MKQTIQIKEDQEALNSLKEKANTQNFKLVEAGISADCKCIEVKTYDLKDLLKKLGFKFNFRSKLWYKITDDKELVNQFKEIQEKIKTEKEKAEGIETIAEYRLSDRKRLFTEAELKFTILKEYKKDNRNYLSCAVEGESYHIKEDIKQIAEKYKFVNQGFDKYWVVELDISKKEEILKSINEMYEKVKPKKLTDNSVWMNDRGIGPYRIGEEELFEA